MFFVNRFKQKTVDIYQSKSGGFVIKAPPKPTPQPLSNDEVRMLLLSD